MDDDPLTRRTEWRGDRGDPYLDEPDSDRARQHAAGRANGYGSQRGTPALTVTILVVLAAVAVGIGIAFGTGLLTPPWVAAEPSPTPGPSPSVAASASPSPGTPTPAPTPATPGGLAPDSVVQTAVDRLNLRSGPSLAAEAMWMLPEAMRGFVISGPIAADGYEWYQLSGLGLPYGSGCITPEPGGQLECPAWLGWLAAAGTDGTPWLVPATSVPPCPGEPPTVVTLSELQFTMRLICYGGDELTFRAWWPEEPTGAGASCPAAETEIAWLACQETNPNGLAGDESETGGRLTVSVHPESGPQMPARGGWIELNGHFDDPAAQDCAQLAELRGSDPAAEIFTCRLQFVVSEVVVVDGP